MAPGSLADTGLSLFRYDSSLIRSRSGVPDSRLLGDFILSLWRASPECRTEELSATKYSNFLPGLFEVKFLDGLGDHDLSRAPSLTITISDTKR